MTLSIVGGTVVDLIFPQVGNLPQWPRHTEFTSTNLVLLETPPLVTLGGNGANAAYVAARCGARVTLHTRIGDDAFGGLATQWLGSAGCGISPTKRTGATAVNVTAANARHERATFFYAGAAPGLPRFSRAARRPHALLVCGWPHPSLSQMAACFRGLHRHGSLTALDVGPLLNYTWSLAELRPVFSHLGLLLANAHEIRRLTRTTSIDAAIKKLRGHYSGHAVIKCGAEGAIWVPAAEDSPRHFPAKFVRTINTVGAGDSFNGGLLAALVAGKDYPAAMRRAATVAASVVASRRGVLGVRP
jgi:ribokinase